MRTVTLYATGQCNLRCKHCAVGNDQYNPRPELTMKQLDIIFSKLEESGTETVTLLGGEVTIYGNDLQEIFQSALEHNLKISVNTNLLSISQLSSILSSQALASIVVSLDGATSNTHDFIRGYGTFVKTITNLHKLKKIKQKKNYKWDIDITFVVNKINRNDGRKLLFLAKELNVNKVNVSLMTEMGRAVDNLAILNMTDNEILATLEEILLEWEKGHTAVLDMYLPPAFVDYYNQKYNRSIPIPIEYNVACGGVSEFAYIDLTGNLLPCPNYAYENNHTFKDEQDPSELSLLTNTVTEILDTQLFKKFEGFRNSGLHKKNFHPCSSCKYKELCLPCTSEFQGGNHSPIVQPCKAIFEKGESKIINTIFTDKKNKRIN